MFVSEQYLSPVIQLQVPLCVWLTSEEEKTCQSFFRGTHKLLKEHVEIEIINKQYRMLIYSSVMMVECGETF